jgi:hypothetical protein
VSDIALKLAGTGGIKQVFSDKICFFAVMSYGFPIRPMKCPSGKIAALVLAAAAGPFIAAQAQVLDPSGSRCCSR